MLTISVSIRGLITSRGKCSIIRTHSRIEIMLHIILSVNFW